MRLSTSHSAKRARNTLIISYRYSMRILRMTCDSEDTYEDAIEAGFGGEWKTE